MDYRRKFCVFGRAAWLQELKPAEAGENVDLKAAGTNPAQSAAAESSHQPAAAWPPCDQLGSWDCLFSSRGD